jgi:hypothetical protein
MYSAATLNTSTNGPRTRRWDAARPCVTCHTRPWRPKRGARWASLIAIAAYMRWLRREGRCSAIVAVVRGRRDFQRGRSWFSECELEAERVREAETGAERERRAEVRLAMDACDQRTTQRVRSGARRGGRCCLLRAKRAGERAIRTRAKLRPALPSLLPAQANAQDPSLAPARPSAPPTRVHRKPCVPPLALHI